MGGSRSSSTKMTPYQSMISDVLNLSDKTTFYICHTNILTLIEKEDSNNFFSIRWFDEIKRKLKQDKCQLTVFVQN